MYSAKLQGLSVLGESGQARVPLLVENDVYVYVYWRVYGCRNGKEDLWVSKMRRRLSARRLVYTCVVQHFRNYLANARVCSCYSTARKGLR